MGKFYFGHLAYNGSQYYGWQKQNDLPSIQESIFNSLRTLKENGNIKVFGASRTDAKVNALCQPVKFLYPDKIEPSTFIQTLNETLPDDIQFIDLDRINPSFKVTHFVTHKSYLYFFSLKEMSRHPFVVQLDGDVDLSRMQTAAKLFEGEHSFHNYQYRSTVKGDFKRKVLKAEVQPASSFFPDIFEDHVYAFHIEANGFLKQMVRIIVGAIINVALGKHSLEELKESLVSSEEKQLGFITPGVGLFLYQIHYPEGMKEEREILTSPDVSSLFEDSNLWGEGIERVSISLSE